MNAGADATGNPEPRRETEILSRQRGGPSGLWLASHPMPLTSRLREPHASATRVRRRCAAHAKHLQALLCRANTARICSEAFRPSERVGTPRGRANMSRTSPGSGDYAGVGDHAARGLRSLPTELLGQAAGLPSLVGRQVPLGWAGLSRARPRGRDAGGRVHLRRASAVRRRRRRRGALACRARWAPVARLVSPARRTGGAEQQAHRQRCAPRYHAAPPC